MEHHDPVSGPAGLEGKPRQRVKGDGIVPQFGDVDGQDGYALLM